MMLDPKSIEVDAELPTIVRSNHLELTFGMPLDLCEPVLEATQCIGFLREKLSPGAPRSIVDQYHHVRCSSFRSYPHGSTKICVNEVECSFSSRGSRGERRAHILAHNTALTDTLDLIRAGYRAFSAECTKEQSHRARAEVTKSPMP